MGSVFLHAVQNSYDGGGENDVGCHLKEKIAADKTEDHVFEGTVKAKTQTPARDRFEKEHHAAEQENARVDDGADDGSSDNRKIAILFFEESEGKSRRKTAESTFDENGHDGAEHIDGEERRCIRAEHNDAEHKAEPCADLGSAGCRADDDGQQYERDGEHPESDELSHILQDDDECCENRSEHEGLGRFPMFDACFHGLFLLAVVRQASGTTQFVLISFPKESYAVKENRVFRTICFSCG